MKGGNNKKERVQHRAQGSGRKELEDGHCHWATTRGSMRSCRCLLSSLFSTLESGANNMSTIIFLGCLLPFGMYLLPGKWWSISIKARQHTKWGEGPQWVLISLRGGGRCHMAVGPLSPIKHLSAIVKISSASNVYDWLSFLRVVSTD